jgi:hypothetical protein
MSQFGTQNQPSEPYDGKFGPMMRDAFLDELEQIGIDVRKRK